MTSFRTPPQGTAQDRRAYNEWLDLCKRIEDTTALGAFETDEVKEKRKKHLQTDFVAFCKYYFQDFMDSDFGWFHKKAIAEIEKDRTVKIVLEWAREHAKSIFADVFVGLISIWPLILIICTVAFIFKRKYSSKAKTA